MMDISPETRGDSGANLYAIANELLDYLLSFSQQQPLDRQLVAGIDWFMERKKY